MAKNSMRVEGHSGKYYELTKFDAMDMLCHCHAKADALASLAPCLCEEGPDRNSPAIAGLALIMQDLADDMNAVTKVLWEAMRNEDKAPLSVVSSK